MANLTAQQVKELADNMLRMTNALGDYRYNNHDKLSEEENQTIKEVQQQQLSYTTEVYTKSALLVMEDVEGSLRKIDQITKDTNKLYEKLTNVQLVIDRATAVLTLAAAIISLDVKGVASSIKNLL